MQQPFYLHLYWIKKDSKNLSSNWECGYCASDQHCGAFILSVIPTETQGAAALPLKLLSLDYFTSCHSSVIHSHMMARGFPSGSQQASCPWYACWTHPKTSLGKAVITVCHRLCSLLAWLSKLQKWGKLTASKLFASSQKWDLSEFNRVLSMSSRGRIVINLWNCLSCG